MSPIHYFPLSQYIHVHAITHTQYLLSEDNVR